MKLKITVDGSCCRRRMYAGLIFRNAENNEIVCLEHRYLSFGTNNQAEYLAIILACRTAHELYAETLEEVSIFTDSQLAFKQLSGAYAVKNGKLRKLYRRAINWMRHRIKVPVHLHWHSREADDGPLADKLASAKYKEVMDESDHRVVKRGAGRNAPGKTSAGQLRTSGRRFHSVEDQTDSSCRCQSNAASTGRTIRIGAAPRRKSNKRSGVRRAQT